MKLADVMMRTDYAARMPRRPPVGWNPEPKRFDDDPPDYWTDERIRLFTLSVWEKSGIPATGDYHRCPEHRPVRSLGVQRVRVLAVPVPNRRRPDGVLVAYTWCQVRADRLFAIDGDPEPEDCTHRTLNLVLPAKALLFPWSEVPVMQLRHDIGQHELLGRVRAGRET